MASPVSYRVSWLDSTSIASPLIYAPLCSIIVFILTYVIRYLQASRLTTPLINPKKFLELSSYRAKMNFVVNARQMIQEGFRVTGNKPFRVIADIGVVTVLPPENADEIRNDEHLSFIMHTYTNFHPRIPGFEAFRASETMKQVTQRQLTMFLNKVTLPLSDEASLSLQDIFTDSKDWSRIVINQKILRIVARMSSKVFLGDELCHNERWLQLTVNYALVGMRGVGILRMFPYYLRDLVHWFIPACQDARALVKEARELITPVLEKRRAQKANFATEGKKATEFNDAVEWYEQVSKGAYYDAAIAQLTLSLAAIHTTTDLATQVIYDLAQNPEIIEPLRKEIIDVLTEGGWKKSSLYNLKLMDSIIKETQRLKPLECATMRRMAIKDVKLSNGTLIPKGSMTAVSSHRMWDPRVYSDPEKWDGYRFYNMRKTHGNENVAQLVCTSADHLAWGHGAHACPGRFFVANEVKILLCHFLLKYDFKLAEGQKLHVINFAFTISPDPTGELLIRRRQEEIDLSSLES